LFVQALPSSQVVPSVLSGFEQVPVEESQVPVLWHWSGSEQVFGPPALQTPFWQVSLSVQALPSLQVEPLGLSGFVHVPNRQKPTLWHWSDAVQTFGVPAHEPAEQ
jgi:hypothetical protein